MKKTIKSLAIIAAMGVSSAAFAQLQDEKNVTITMDLQPILQLNMQGPENLDFVFDQISEYIGGITKYGATQLTVSSTVDWDLYAAGTSTNGVPAAVGAGPTWDQASPYGSITDPNGVDLLPISLLELHQNQVNSNHLLSSGTWFDYSTAFTQAAAVATVPPVPGQNSIYATTTPYTLPLGTEKYIAGHFSNTAFVAGGSYLTQVGAVNNFRYIMDYRILPGLPATFPAAGNNAGVSNALDDLTPGRYARPGIYTMNVKYVLVQNQ